MSQKKIVRVGTRNSQLAMIQTNKVIEWLKEKHENIEFEIVAMKTTGDKILDTALAKIGEKNLFTKELELALQDCRVDFLVHSLKDLPTTLPEGMVIGAVCRRDDPRDAVMMHPKHKVTELKALPEGSVVGSSSLRRQAQLKRNFPHLTFDDVRGNLNTRKRKLDEDNRYDCLILAKAGLDRMGWEDRISSVLDPSTECMYAVCQGAMAVECREGDLDIYNLLACINDRSTTLQCVAERAFLKTLEGGCSVPIAVNTDLKHDQLSLRGGVYSIGGEQEITADVSTRIPDDAEPPKKRSPRVTTTPNPYSTIISLEISDDAMQAAESLGVSLANKLSGAGARAIVDKAKKTIADEILMQKAEKEARLKALSADNKENDTRKTELAANAV